MSITVSMAMAIPNLISMSGSNYFKVDCAADVDVGFDVGVDAYYNTDALFDIDADLDVGVDVYRHR